MREILEEESLDVLVVILLLHPLGVVLPTFTGMDNLPAPPLPGYLSGVLEAAARIRKATGRDIVFVMENRANLPQDVSIEEAFRTYRLRFHGRGIPVYPTVSRALRAIRNVARGPRV